MVGYSKGHLPLLSIGGTMFYNEDRTFLERCLEKILRTWVFISLLKNRNEDDGYSDLKRVVENDLDWLKKGKD